MSAFLTPDKTVWNMHSACDVPLSMLEFRHQCFTGFGGSEDDEFYDSGSLYRHPGMKARKSRNSEIGVEIG